MNVFTGFRGAENVERTGLASGLGRAAAECFLPAGAALIHADGLGLTRKRNAARVLFIQRRPRLGRIRPANLRGMLTGRGDITGCEEALASARERAHVAFGQVAAGFTSSPARKNHVPFSKGIHPWFRLPHPFRNGIVTFLHFHRPFLKGLLPLFISSVLVLMGISPLDKWLIPFYSGSYDLLSGHVPFFKGSQEMLGGHVPFLNGNGIFINSIDPIDQENHPFLEMHNPFSQGISAGRGSVAPRSLRHRPARRGSVPGWRCVRAGRPRQGAGSCRMVAARCFRVPTGRGADAVSGWGMILDAGTTAISRRTLNFSPALHPPQLSGLPSFNTLLHETSDLLPTSDQ